MTHAPPWPGPFRRLAFETLPEAPRRPHSYFSAEAHDLTMDSEPFGRLTVHYRTGGEGPPLLLVHGLMTTGYSYRYVLDSLGAHFRLFVPDLPGCGRSDKPAGRYGPRALAVWMGEFMRATGIHGCAAVGNSLGGYLCMWLALLDPGAFSQLVNIHSPGIPELRLHALHAALRVPGVRAGLARWVRRDPFRWAHSNVHYFDETLKSLEEAREYGGPLATPEGSAAFVAYLAETLAPGEMARFNALLEKRVAEGLSFPIPLLLIYARQDPMVPPSVGDALHRLIPSATMVRLNDTSHFAHVDSPDRLVPEIIDFLQ
jgi:pimeloyl-ACP methyl ester carboxylesterase